MTVTKFLMAACAVVAVAGCAGRNLPRACEPVPVEFFKAGGPVYRDCDVDSKVTPPVVGRAPMVMQGFRPTQACGRVVIDVVVDTTGYAIRETAKVTRSNDSQLQQIVLASLTDYRYGPAVKNGPSNGAPHRIAP